MSAALVRMPDVAEALGVKAVITARRWCAKHGVPIIELNSRSKAVRREDLERSLLAAAGKECVDAD
jgi:hypothetical protein